jgi:hypothetical protein
VSRIQFLIRASNNAPLALLGQLNADFVSTSNLETL